MSLYQVNKLLRDINDGSGTPTGHPAAAPPPR
jgi:hypothetical protein